MRRIHELHVLLYCLACRVAFEAQLRRILNQLPQENRHTLAFLVLHLQNVADNSSLTQMNASNLAKCLGPSIVGKELYFVAFIAFFPVKLALVK